MCFMRRSASPLKHTDVCICIRTLSESLRSNDRKTGEKNRTICLVLFNHCHAISVNINMMIIFPRSLYRDLKPTEYQVDKKVLSLGAS